MTDKQFAHKVLWDSDNEEEVSRRPALVEAGGGRALGPELMLEVALKAGEAPLRFLGTVQNFTAGEVTLKVEGPAPWMDWERLAGHEASLHGNSLGDAQGKGLKGKVIRARKGGGAEGPAVVVVALHNMSGKARKALEDQLLRPPKDIKGLWERWDKKQEQASVVKVGSQVLYLFGLALLVTGLVLSFRGAFGYLPVLLMAAGGGMVAFKTLWSFFQK